MSNRTCKAMIADDEPHIRALLAFLLKDLGADVIEAENGEDAIIKFNKFQPDLILLDVNMPKIDGITVLKLIKQKKPQTQVIMLTAVNAVDIVQKCINNGADNYILKDASAEELHNIIKDIWNNHLSIS